MPRATPSAPLTRRPQYRRPYDTRRTLRKPNIVRTRKHKAPVQQSYSTSGGGMKSQMKMTQVSDTCLRIVGRSYLGAVSNIDRAEDSIALMADINPSLLGDRVAVLANTYDKYCYQSCTFTYVPQCPTSQAGSVMMAFERDPEAPLANSQGSTFMQEVMSYEHAKLTPAWVSASVTYKRDPHEKRTYFLGGEQASIDSRTTSQGTFIAYTSNCPAANLGFVVMDFVLDLVSPNIIPTKTVPQTPTQWIRQNNTEIGITQANNSTTWTTSVANVGSGTIFEIVVDEATTTQYKQLDVNNSTAVAFTLKPGSRFYAVYYEASDGNTATAVARVTCFQQLTGAIAYSGGGFTSTAIGGSVNNGVTWNAGSAFIGTSTNKFLNGSCWARVLSTRTGLPSTTV